MYLTRNFQLAEFATSRQFPGLAQKVEFSAAERERLRFFCASVLEPLRRKVDSPIVITSGKRTVELNQAVAGHPHSHHLFRADHGACDIVIPGVPPETAATVLINFAVVRSINIYPDFLHLSFPDSTGAINQIFHHQN
jgi:hypothetical protein